MTSPLFASPAVLRPVSRRKYRKLVYPVELSVAFLKCPFVCFRSTEPFITINDRTAESCLSATAILTDINWRSIQFTRPTSNDYYDLKTRLRQLVLTRYRRNRSKRIACCEQFRDISTTAHAKHNDGSKPSVTVNTNKRYSTISDIYFLIVIIIIGTTSDTR